MHDFKKDIDLSLQTLKKGGVIIYPTDTIWGIGCDATNSKAVEKIFKIKKRHHSKSIIVLLDTEEKLSLYVKKVPEIAKSLIRSYNKPLTIIYPNAKNLAKNVIAKDGSIAIRVVRDDDFCIQLCKEFEKPITSTSANISGEGNPLIFRGIQKEIIDKADYVVEHYRDFVKEIKPSTIVKIINDNEYEILRK